MRSASDKRHPYLRGYKWWKDNVYWNNGMYTEKGKAYLNEFLNNMQKKDHKLSSVSDQAR